MIFNTVRLSSVAFRAPRNMRNFATVRAARFQMIKRCQGGNMFFAARSFGSIAGQGSVNLGELVGQRMPGFKSSSVLDGCLCDLDSQEYFKDSYGLLVFYPLDFTFVCPSELLGISERLSDFEKRGVKVVGVSVDSPFSHLAWSQMELKKGGIEGIKFPLVSDVSRSITKSFGLMRPEGFAQRASVLIDKQGMVRHVAVFDLGIGRSVDEMLRMFDAIQHFDASGQVCPANWQKGRDAMSPTATSTGEYLHKTYQKA